MMNKIGFDGHATLGIIGAATTTALAYVNGLLSAGIGLATLAYMSRKAWREWAKK